MSNPASPSEFSRRGPLAAGVTGAATASGYYGNVPAQPTTTLRKLYGQLGSAAQNQLWFNKLHAVIDGYQPDISLYATRAWAAYGEGPTQPGGGSFTQPRAGTPQGIRNNQWWRLNDTANGQFQIINRGTNTALDSLGDRTVGSNVAMWAPNNHPNNLWTITAV